MRVHGPFDCMNGLVKQRRAPPFPIYLPFMPLRFFHKNMTVCAIVLESQYFTLNLLVGKKFHKQFTQRDLKHRNHNNKDSNYNQCDSNYATSFH